jgi:hypothetical protein
MVDTAQGWLAIFANGLVSMAWTGLQHHGSRAERISSKMSQYSICPDCGRNSEFILHEEGCPQFGKEVEEFIEKHDAEIASWPEGARQALEDLNAMHSLLFKKWLALHRCSPPH